MVLENARRKARAVAAATRRSSLGCDTEVVLDGGLLGKPGDEGQAREYLERLSGRGARGAERPRAGRARAGEQSEGGGALRGHLPRALSRTEIERYLRSGEWRERAGGYAIQGLGSTLVAAVEGDLSNVIGLPIGLLLELAPELAAGASSTGHSSTLRARSLRALPANWRAPECVR